MVAGSIGIHGIVVLDLCQGRGRGGGSGACSLAGLGRGTCAGRSTGIPLGRCMVFIHGICGLTLRIECMGFFGSRAFTTRARESSA